MCWSEHMFILRLIYLKLKSANKRNVSGQDDLPALTSNFRRKCWIMYIHVHKARHSHTHLVHILALNILVPNFEFQCLIWLSIEQMETPVWRVWASQPQFIFCVHCHNAEERGKPLETSVVAAPTYKTHIHWNRPSLKLCLQCMGCSNHTWGWLRIPNKKWKLCCSKCWEISSTQGHKVLKENCNQH